MKEGTGQARCSSVQKEPLVVPRRSRGEPLRAAATCAPAVLSRMAGVWTRGQRHELPNYCRESLVSVYRGRWVERGLLFSFLFFEPDVVTHSHRPVYVQCRAKTLFTNFQPLLGSLAHLYPQFSSPILVSSLYHASGLPSSHRVFWQTLCHSAPHGRPNCILLNFIQISVSSTRVCSLVKTLASFPKLLSRRGIHNSQNK